VKAAAAYFAVAVALTWPLARGLTRDVPWDMGDPVLNTWILGWTSDHFVRVLSGDLSAAREFWHANIFHPSPYTLAYSEHLAAQALQTLPVYAATGNLLLCYNLLFISSGALSAFTMYLLTRELTGDAKAAFVAGLLFGFSPVRVDQFSHLQTISTQWAPLAVYGFRRYFERGSLGSLAIGAAAFILQNLSSGYLLLFFGLLIAAYIAFELSVRGRWRDVRTLAHMAAAGLAVASGTAPFVWGYLQIRGVDGQFRGIGEVELYSADVYGYFTASTALNVWGSWMRAFPKAENHLFLGIGVMALALAAVVFSVVHARRAARAVPKPVGRRRALAITACLVAVVYLSIAITITFFGGFVDSFAPLPISRRTVPRSLGFLTLASIVLLSVSARARAFARALGPAPLVFFTIAALVAAWLSLGPDPRTMGRRLSGLGLYALFYEYVPGFDGPRVPARFSIVTLFCAAAAAAYGAARLRKTGRLGATAVWAAALFGVVESAPLPLSVNAQEQPRAGRRPPPARLYVGDQAPPIYRALAELKEPLILVEYPFNDIAWVVQSEFYSTLHWHRLVNGYSGHSPSLLVEERDALGQPLRRPDAAWRALYAHGATHVLVHEEAYPLDARQMQQWLLKRGARMVMRFGQDALFVLPNPAVVPRFGPDGRSRPAAAPADR
jgi:hypothetical protein